MLRRENVGQVESVPLMRTEEDWREEELDDLVLPPFGDVLDSIKSYPQTVQYRKLWKHILIVSVVSFVVGAIVPSFFYKSFLSHPVTSSSLFPRTEVLPDNIFTEIEFRNIIREYHRLNKMKSEELSLYIKEKWLKQGLDTATVLSYNSFISLPNKEKPNQILVIDENEKPVETLLLSNNNSSSTESVNCAFSSGNDQFITEDLVYNRFGRLEDFLELKKLNINVYGKIIITQIGKNSIASKVILAQRFGAVGIILFPGQSANESSNVHCNDFLYYLKDFDVENGDKQNLNILNIPVYLVTFKNAEKLLRHMNGSASNWTDNSAFIRKSGVGVLNKNWKIKMEIHAQKINQTLFNVIGRVHGQIEKDRLVMVGISGRSQNLIGISAILEITRIIGKLIQNGRRPWRSILFCIRGVDNSLKGYQKIFKAHTVAYLDSSLLGRSVQIVSTPLLHKETVRSVEKIIKFKSAEIEKQKTSDNLLNKTFIDNLKSKIEDLDSMGYIPQYHLFGTSTAKFQYSCKATDICQSFCGAENDLIEGENKSFYYQELMVQIWTEMICSLSSSVILPFDMTSYFLHLNNTVIALQEKYGILFEENGILLNSVESAVKKFYNSTENFKRKFLSKEMDIKNISVIRSINDKLMTIEKSFIGIDESSKKYKRHTLYGPSEVDTCHLSTFPTLMDPLIEMTVDHSQNLWDSIKKQISVIVFHFRAASNALHNSI